VELISLGGPPSLRDTGQYDMEIKKKKLSKKAWSSKVRPQRHRIPYLFFVQGLTQTSWVQIKTQKHRPMLAQTASSAETITARA
jgi:hypothetical protein